MDEFCALLPTGGRVLDLCCGAGYESFRLHRRGFEPVGLDFSGESLAIAREKNPGVSFYQGDMLESYPQVGAVDGIICIAGLVHVETADLPLAFRRMGEVLKPGGYLLASVRYGTGRWRNAALPRSTAKSMTGTLSPTMRRSCPLLRGRRSSWSERCRPI